MILLQRMKKRNSHSSPTVISKDDKRSGKLLTALLLGLTYMTLGTIQYFLNVTMPLMGVNLGPIEEKTVRRREIVFTIRQIGYVCGFLCGGVAFDYYVMPMEKQALISLMLVIIALNSFIVPFFTNMVRMGIILFISGASMTFVSTGINTYIMGLYGENSSNTGIQFVYACYSLGKVATILGARSDYSKFSEKSNITHAYENRKKAFMKLFVSYSTISAVIVVLSLTWICLYRFSPEEYQNHVPFDESRQKKTKLGFKTLAVVTTVPLLICASFFDISYETLMRNYATLKLGSSVDNYEKPISIYFICTVLGRQASIVIAYKWLSPAWMITIDLLGMLFAACLMSVLNSFGHVLMWVVPGLVGLSSASLVPSTIAWLNSHIVITGKNFGYMCVANVITLMTVPIWMHETVEYDPEAPIYYMFFVPFLYATIFGIQVALFRRERNFRSFRL